MNSPVTIEQLINELKKYPQDYHVLVDGYEGGLDAILSTKEIGVKYDESKAWYYGAFDEDVGSDIKAVRLLSTRGQRV